jgi:uridine kinase
MKNEKNKSFEKVDLTIEREIMEVEKKFTLSDPHFFDFYKQSESVKEIYQVYLSHPKEAFSLRMRKTKSGHNTSYSAAQKTRGEVTNDGLARLETPTLIDQETFDQYVENGHYPALKKLRVEPMPGVTIDWIEGWPDPIVEVENYANNEEALQFLHVYEDLLIDRSGEPDVDNEHIAYALSGKDVESDPYVELTPEKVVEELLAYQSIGYKQIVVGLSGRSGSGKTTLARQVQTLLQERNLNSTLLSTDDYHVGKSKLERTYGAPWLNWDSSVVYDTERMAEDIKLLQKGEMVQRRSFSFETQEPYMGSTIEPTNIIIVEGIHAGSNHLKDVRTLYFELPTSLSTCIGRDISRLRNGSRPNSSIGSTEERFLYQLQYAEPEYLNKDRPPRNSWSGCARSMGAIALDN